MPVDFGAPGIKITTLILAIHRQPRFFFSFRCHYLRANRYLAKRGQAGLG